MNPCVDCLLLGQCRSFYIEESYKKYYILIYMFDLQERCCVLRDYLNRTKSFPTYTKRFDEVVHYLIGENNVKTS